MELKKNEIDELEKKKLNAEQNKQYRLVYFLYTIIKYIIINV